MRRYRKLVSILCAVALLVSALPAAAADSEPNSAATENFVIVERSPGKWSRVPTSYFSARFNLSNKNSVQVSADEQFDSIYKTTHGQYFQEIEEGVFTPVKEVRIRLNDHVACSELSQYNLPSEMMDTILSASQYIKQLNDNNASVSIFISDISTDAVAKASPEEPWTLAPQTTTWNGYTFHSYTMYFLQLPTGWVDVVNGANTTEKTLDFVKDLALYVGEQKLGAPLGLFKSGLSCLGAWLNAGNSTVYYGNSNNKVQTQIYR